jgi:hypothetical protein
MHGNVPKMRLRTVLEGNGKEKGAVGMEREKVSVKLERLATGLNRKG